MSDQVVHWTIAYVYLEFNMIKRKTLTWDSSVALLSPTCYYSASKKTPGKKSLFLVPKNVFYVIFFFSCLKMIFCELMLLELGDLLGLPLLRNLFSAARSKFSCKYFNKIAQYFQLF